MSFYKASLKFLADGSNDSRPVLTPHRQEVTADTAGDFRKVQELADGLLSMFPAPRTWHG